MVRCLSELWQSGALNTWTDLMIHTLLSNRMEDLVNPLATLLAVPVANPLAPDTIMVQHPGMEHWLPN